MSRAAVEDAGAGGRERRVAGWDWPIDLVTRHARTIMAGTPSDLERVARAEGMVP